MKAGIYITQGMLVVDFTSYNRVTLHYDIEYSVEDNNIIVTGDKALFDVSLTKGEFDISLITKDSITYQKLFPWSKSKPISKNWVEYKDRKRKTYTSNHFTIIT